jgi:hypothetical protein
MDVQAEQIEEVDKNGSKNKCEVYDENEKRDPSNYFNVELGNVS